MRSLKKWACIPLAFLIAFAVTAVFLPANRVEAATNVAINANNFPDAVFRQYVSDNFDTNNDGDLSDSEIKQVKSIEIDSYGVRDLKGIQYFTTLERLRCGGNQLTSLDVSNNTALETLYCAENQLTSLNFRNNTALENLACWDNQLTSLDVSNNTALFGLVCFNNQLTSLDVSNNTALETLYCADNQLTSLDVSKNTALFSLDCSENELTSLDVSKNTALGNLNCADNQLTSLNVSKNTKLGELHCNDNQLTSLNVYNNTILSSLYCSNNYLSTRPTPGPFSLQLYVNFDPQRTVTIKTQPQDYTGAVGSTAKFTVAAEGATGLKYQWQAYTNGKWVDSALPGATTKTLSVLVTLARNGYKFRCIVTDSNNQKMKSKSATLNVESTPLSITTQPSNYTGTVGSTARFTITAQGSGLKYQWQTYIAGAWKNSSLTGYNTATLSVSVTQSRNGYKFRCVVTDSSNKTVTSNAATLTVTGSASVSITTQPKYFVGPVGSTATFKVVAQGVGLKYQWQTYSAGAWKNSSLTGYNTATLSVPVTAARNGYKFRCVVTDSANKTVTSNAVTLTVTGSASLSITTQPKDYKGVVGSTASFKVVAQGSGLKYQWQTYSSGSWKNSSLPGYNTATLSVPVIASRNGYKFRCVVTDANNKTVTSNAVTLRVGT